VSVAVGAFGARFGLVFMALRSAFLATAPSWPSENSLVMLLIGVPMTLMSPP
jgi:hypothetical protein